MAQHISIYEAAPLVAIIRGDIAESWHRGHLVVLDGKGQLIAQLGDPNAITYLRSASKPQQALPLVVSGAADRFGFTEAELALACGSHNGDAIHTATVCSMLSKIGLDESALQCGAHEPYGSQTAREMRAAGLNPTALHNNCSGKHAGMLAVCRHVGDPTRGYMAIDHPQQRRIVAVLEAMLGTSLANAPRGVDGCGLPQIGVSLLALARGMARFGSPDDIVQGCANACRSLAAAIVAEPFMLAGTNRFCSRVIAACAGAVLVKSGAEGVYVAALPGLGLGIALKIDDGALRAAEVAMSHLLMTHARANDDARVLLAELATPTLFNVAGNSVGQIEIARRGAHRERDGRD